MMIAIQKLFNRKSRTEILDDFIDNMLVEITNKDFNNDEIACIINSLGDKGKHLLEKRAALLKDEYDRTLLAIESMR